MLDQGHSGNIQLLVLCTVITSSNLSIRSDKKELEIGVNELMLLVETCSHRQINRSIILDRAVVYHPVFCPLASRRDIPVMR